LTSKPLPAHWKPRIRDAQQERSVAVMVQQYGLSDLLARILTGRQIAPEDAQDFLHPRLKNSMPDPFHLQDMDKAVARIVQAIAAKEQMAIFGDYDVDGATSSALLVRYFRAFGLEPLVYIPDRMKEGYGPSSEAFLKLKEQGASLIITVDCGTVAFDPVITASEQDMDVIIVDHHQALPQLPEAVAVVNPNRLDQISDCGNLAAVGVTWLLLAAVNAALRDASVLPQPDLLALLDLVALGTVCDVVSLTGLNRAFVSQGLRVMAGRKNTGLRCLSDVSRMDETPAAYHAGFLLGPRINAGGRVGEAALGYRLLSSEDEEECLKAAEILDRFNDERRTIEQLVLEAAQEKAMSQENQPCICVAGDGWHEGVIGIVAGRLKESYDRPAMVLAVNDGMAKGSARSVPGADIGAAVSAAKQEGLVSAGGGHAMAAGFSLPAEGIAAFEAFMRDKLAPAVSDYQAGRYVSYDAVVDVAALTMDVAGQLALAEPYGMGNPAPRLVLRDVEIPYVQKMKDVHLRLSVRSGSAQAQAVCFSCVGTETGDVLERGGRVHLLGQLKKNRWQGRETVQFVIQEAVTA
jgi:single-stranded-DNA-specific exonuclease